MSRKSLILLVVLFVFAPAKSFSSEVSLLEGCEKVSLDEGPNPLERYQQGVFHGCATGVIGAVVARYALFGYLESHSQIKN